MAIDRTTASDVGFNLVQMYGDLEARLIVLLRDQINRAVRDPVALAWAERHLSEAIALREAATLLVQGLASDVREHASKAILDAATIGRRAALAEAQWYAFGKGDIAPGKGLGELSIRSAIAFGDEGNLPGASAITRIANAFSGRLLGLNVPIVRWVDDAFRNVIARGAVPGILAGIDTRRKAAEGAWNALLKQGVTGFVDSRGRNWNLSTYVEMATRTTTMQASVAAHSGQLTHLGIKLVVVSDVPGECELCRPWEGKILALDGVGGKRVVMMPRADDEREMRPPGRTTTITGANPGTPPQRDRPAGGYSDMVKIPVAGSVNEATGAGLFHPHCRHTISAYLPGLSTLPRNTTDVGLSEARVELRGLERDVRKWKTRAAGALTPEARAEANARAKAAQAEIATLIDERGGVERGLPRRPDRERVNLGNKVR